LIPIPLEIKRVDKSEMKRRTKRIMKYKMTTMMMRERRKLKVSLIMKKKKKRSRGGETRMGMRMSKKKMIMK
jgi:hypothetical protein